MQKPGEQGKALEDGEHAQQSPQEEAQHLASSSDDGRLAGRRGRSGAEWIHPVSAAWDFCRPEAVEE
jgi:hypothetical protein